MPEEQQPKTPGENGNGIEHDEQGVPRPKVDTNIDDELGRVMRDLAKHGILPVELPKEKDEDKDETDK